MLRNTILASLLASGAMTLAVASPATASEKDRAREAIATGSRTYIKNGIANAGGTAADDLFMTKDAEAERVDERIQRIRFVERDLTADRRDSERVAVVRDSGNDSRQQ